MGQLATKMTPIYKPRDYDGTTPWRDYSCHFGKVCELNGWTEKKLEYLWVVLSGAALSYAQGLLPEQNGTYEAMDEALNNRFGAARLADVYKSELKARRRREGESISVLGQEIRRLVQCAFPHRSPDMQEEEAVERFIEALTDAKQRENVHHIKAKTLEAAIEEALTIEAWQLKERKRIREEGGDPTVNLYAAQARSEDSILERILNKLEILDVG